MMAHPKVSDNTSPAEKFESLRKTKMNQFFSEVRNMELEKYLFIFKKQQENFVYFLYSLILLILFFI